jgi:ribosomal protein L35AE/L33A
MPNSICPCKFRLSSRPTYWEKSSLETGKEQVIGKIAGFHGKKGVVKVKFRKGVPGQALGTTVELVR